MEEITLAHTGAKVLKANYIKLKTLDLIEFGYSNLTEKETEEQVDKILKGDSDLSIIGEFCKEDILVQP